MTMPSAIIKAIANRATERPGMYAFGAAGVALAIAWGLNAPTFFGLAWSDKALLLVVAGFAYQQFQIQSWRRELTELNVWVRTTLSEIITQNTTSLGEFRHSQELTQEHLEDLRQAVSRINGEPQDMLPNRPGSALDSKYGVNNAAETVRMVVA